MKLKLSGPRNLVSPRWAQTRLASTLIVLVYVHAAISTSTTILTSCSAVGGVPKRCSRNSLPWDIDAPQASFMCGGFVTSFQKQRIQVMSVGRASFLVVLFRWHVHTRGSAMYMIELSSKAILGSRKFLISSFLKEL